jgi:hypothetical protein
MGEAGRRCHSRLLSWSARAGGYYRNTRMARSLAAAAVYSGAARAVAGEIKAWSAAACKVTVPATARIGPRAPLRGGRPGQLRLRQPASERACPAQHWQV